MAKKSKFCLSAPQASLAAAQRTASSQPGRLKFQLRQCGSDASANVVAAFGSLTLSAAAADAVSTVVGWLLLCGLILQG
jgi:hypothetical protein